MIVRQQEKISEPAAVIVRKKQKKAAVKCWFTSSGRAIPLSMKLQDENGEIVCVEEIYVEDCIKKYYAGNVSWEYKCRIPVQGKIREVILLFQPETCCWKLLFS